MSTINTTPRRAGLHPDGVFNPRNAMPGAISWQHEYALELSQWWGYSVGPLNGKVPLTHNGFKSFTSDRAQVNQWWGKWPGANIGARPAIGEVVLDIDPRNGGLQTWEKINAGNKLPFTRVTVTGSGGFHYWFNLPEGINVKGTAGPGIDVKTHKGYLVMPGSVHPDTGRAYRWLKPFVYHLAELPAWLIPHVEKKAPTVATPTPVAFKPGASWLGLVKAVVAAAPGERNNVLYWAACRAYENNLTVDSELTQAARAAGLSDSEIASTLTSARNAAVIGGVAA